MREKLKVLIRPIWNHPYIFVLRGHFFDLIEYLTDYKKEKERFEKNLGYKLNLKNPRTFSERIVYKKINDRNKILSEMADKYKVRNYIKKVLGNDADKHLVPLLFVSEKPESIPFENFNCSFIAKVNHNSGPHFMVKSGESFDKNKIISGLKEQLKYPYGILKHEWAYKHIKPRTVIVEKLLTDQNGNLPKDYKFHMINGVCAFIQVDFDRFTDHSRSLYDENWNFIKGTLKFKQGPEISIPENFNKMLDLARKLSKPFDYLRVDLYSINNCIYIGELTHYPGSGVEKFTPQSLDFEFGKYFTKI